jgi:hypothetical protein
MKRTDHGYVARCPHGNRQPLIANKEKNDDDAL